LKNFKPKKNLNHNIDIIMIDSSVIFSRVLKHRVFVIAIVKGKVTDYHLNINV